MLVIRGSNSVMDWSINLEEEMCDYSYTHIVRKDDVFVSSSLDPLEDSSSGSSASGGKKGMYITNITYTGSSTTALTNISTNFTTANNNDIVNLYYYPYYYYYYCYYFY